MGMSDSRRPKVLIVSTGGTIASRYDPVGRAMTSTATGDQLLAALGDLAPSTELTLDEFSNLGSNRIDLDMSFRLARHIAVRMEEDAVCGCVVTHGTDTLEESAFLASLVISSGKPVVFTGAQRGIDASDADGPRNLADAIRVAASPSARDLGVLVVFGGRILSATDATKVNTWHLDGYGSTSFGTLGEVDGEMVLIGRRPMMCPAVNARDIETRVDLITLAMGADARLFDAAVASGARGIVLETFGRGNATPELVAAVRRATNAGIFTVVTSRCAQGRVLPVYDDGGGRDLEDAGALFAGRLKGPKARILLCLALSHLPRSKIVDLLMTFGM
ncbi:asparaginase [Ensifer adhaerens]|uniref:asparaginase n=1 Tax=Ensifer adhaerens TaxID=106592 RepID=UPI001CC1C0B2|nr:asparaginase [Ensifer adhaerens]MBZ7925034.1 asparaginase [Ensifer adhaerens]UAX95771.1 asparaginase [Ensifer adhaerens]UAY04888.1 asparaginase [Ensifer adhaerens]UAY10320.1 asparaginase [Ensifer adhaerens]